eukprot:scaffold34218_cov59-Phaeocystis_antarctica.AAC.1
MASPVQLAMRRLARVGGRCGERRCRPVAPEVRRRAATLSGCDELLLGHRARPEALHVTLDPLLPPGEGWGWGWGE